MRSPFPTQAVSLLPLFALIACGSSGGGSGGAAGSGGSGGAGGSSGNFTGTYAATFSGMYQNTSPNTESGPSSSTATITVTNVSSNEVELSWQVAPNPPSGTAVFVMSGSTGELADGGAVAVDAGGASAKGSCFTGLVNGNTQTNCCTSCSVSFSGDTLTQPNAGFYFGTTPAGVDYKGTYSGIWTGTRQ